MHSGRREAGSASAASSDDANDSASGFTGFSDAQLTRMRRFYHDAQTGSERKPIRGDGDNGDNRGNDDGSETPTSLAPGQTQFPITPKGNDMNNRESHLYLIVELIKCFNR